MGYKTLENFHKSIIQNHKKRDFQNNYVYIPSQIFKNNSACSNIFRTVNTYLFEILRKRQTVGTSSLKKKYERN